MIGVFDSGVGGLSVLREIRAALPSADLLYVADRGRAPYGTRSLDEVEAISIEVSDWLVGRGAETVVVACNTASAAALESIRARHPGLPVVGMEPAVKPAAVISNTANVAVFATAATFQGRLFASVVDRFASGVEVQTRACPQWVEMVERGVVDGAEAVAEIEDVVREVVDGGADVIVLACTHFSFLSGAIADISGVEVIDPAPAVAAQTARVAPNKAGSGRTTLATSGPIEELRALALGLVGLDAAMMVYEP